MSGRRLLRRVAPRNDRFGRVSNHGENALARQRRKVCRVLDTLPCAPLVARLVLGAYQAVRTASAFGYRIDIAPRLADRFLNMVAVDLGRLEDPGLADGVTEKATEFRAMLAIAADRARPAPVAWRRERFGDARPQVREARCMQPIDCGRCIDGTRRRFHRVEKRFHGGHQYRVRIIGAWPGKNVRRRDLPALRRSRQCAQQINDEAGSTTGPCGCQTLAGLGCAGSTSTSAAAAARSSAACSGAAAAARASKIGAGGEGRCARCADDTLDRGNSSLARQQAERVQQRRVVGFLIDAGRCNAGDECFDAAMSCSRVKAEACASHQLDFIEKSCRITVVPGGGRSPHCGRSHVLDRG